MFNASYKIATVWGIPIKIHISLIILILYIITNIPKEYGLWAAPIGIAIAILMFTSVALHELGHSFVAIRKGCKVRSITLYCIGGIAAMERMPLKPRDEFMMAAAGPAVSILLGVLGIASSLSLRSLEAPIIYWFSMGLFFLGYANLFLAGFNLIPAFPMDGGRMLRAFLTRKQGRLKATYIASRIGRFLAFVFGTMAVSNMFNHTNPRGLAILHIVIAVFIYKAADREYQMVKAQEAANAYGMGSWSSEPTSEWKPDEDVADNVVQISPPPYKSGPGSKSQIHTTDEDNPFTNLFGR